ncbi:MAG: DOPA 4,5-dioxygenase family protein [Psychromonas sp.]
MSEIKRPINVHQKYHAHLYFDSETLAFATDLGKQVAEKFFLKVGRVHQKAVGPHARWSCQILFGQDDFETLIPWLDNNRGNLSILVHADTGDDLKDHTDYAYWLGDESDLNLSMFM